MSVLTSNITKMVPPLLLAISGPSSSGKTTLARLLRDVFPPSRIFILHLDDFYLTDAEIPVKNGIQDWDCLESINLPELQRAIHHIKAHGKSPDWLFSKEDQNSVGDHGVPATELDRIRNEVNTLLNTTPGWQDRRICIIEGFLLFSEDMKEIRSLFDVKLFLWTNYETAKRRREARIGYVTLEGFWQDPPGYVDQIVWPNYVHDHKFLFKNNDVQDDLDPDVCKAVGICGMPRGAEESMSKCLEWAVDVLKGSIKQS